jgi:L-threonylcarbamoyladenylate synthase
VESTVLDVTSSTPILLRPGGTTVEQLRQVIGRVELSPKAAMLARSPGVRHRHYRPRAEVALVLPRADLWGVVEKYRTRGLRTGLICSRSAKNIQWPDDLQIQLLPESLSGYAKGLFAAIRALDELGVDIIVVQGVEDHGLGLAVMDRLRRAASLVVDEHGQAVVTA